MATALAYPDKEKGGRGKKSLANNEFSGASSGYIRQARFVLSNCRDKALEVLRNAKYPLTVAYEEAQAIVEQQRLAEEERQRQLAALATQPGIVSIALESGLQCELRQSRPVNRIPRARG